MSAEYEKSRPARLDKMIISWQEWVGGNQTSSDEELAKVDAEEIRELLDD